jgi:hypothetical protein
MPHVLETHLTTGEYEAASEAPPLGPAVSVAAKTTPQQVNSSCDSELVSICLISSWVEEANIVYIMCLNVG